MAGGERNVAVRRLRIRGAGSDPLRVQLSVDRLLAAADVRPTGLPPAAILVVRSLTDPLPGQLDCRAVLPAARWQGAVASALGERAARAARPASGVASGDADAVLFADRAELLACLGRAWCDGSLTRTWWWRALGLDTPASALQAFSDTPEAVPAALAQLAPSSVAASLAALVPPNAAAALVRAVGAAFGAAAAVEAALEPPAESRRHVPAVAPLLADPVAVAGPVAPAPWSALPGAAASAVSRLAPEQEVLLGIALALWSRPGAVRGAAFATAARAWRMAATVGGAAPAGAPAPRHPGVRDTRRPGTPASRPARSDRSPAPRRSAGGARAPSISRSRARAREPSAVAPHAREPHRERAAQVAPAAPRPRAAEDPATKALAASIQTELGGLFHLVHVGQLLGLYGDFTTPAQPGIALPVWDFVTLLGGRLLGRRPRDPVWALLAELTGRGPADVPGRGYRPPRAWRVPRDWIAPFPLRGSWRAAETEGRLQLIHPAGFVAVDAPDAHLARELRRYGLHEPIVRGEAVSLPALSARERWLEHLTTYVRARLAVALGVRTRRAARLALARPALVYVTDTRVDVVSALAELPIEVRLAGLDRDPGYVPAAGRALLFHFE